MKHADNFTFYLSILIVLLSILTLLISKHVPTVYMDEQFHIPQVIEYMRGNWLKWDPMITTPPGLYLFTVFFLRTLQVSGEAILNFRLINFGFAIGIFSVSKAICSEADPFGNERALLITLLPNLFIFYGLYYTDPGSVFFVLLARWSLNRNFYFLFLVASIIALGFRQTNIIWTGLFCVADEICDRIDGNLRLIFERRRLLLNDIGLSIFLWAIFIIAVYLNGGSIVLGDKGNHVSSLHLAQLFYCTSFIFLFSGPLIIGKPVNLLSYCLFNIGSFGAIRFGSIFHKYLMADNRHWTNLVWRRILRFERLRNYLIPVHGLGAYLIFSVLKEARGCLWALGYFCTCAIVLIPSPLIEPRYYILPFVFFLLNAPLKSRKIVNIQIATLILANIFLVGYFIYFPFKWENDSTQLQRRIW